MMNITLMELHNEYFNHNHSPGVIQSNVMHLRLQLILIVVVEQPFLKRLRLKQVQVTSTQHSIEQKVLLYLVD